MLYSSFPQAFLGLTFNLGALMGWAAVRSACSAATLWFAAGWESYAIPAYFLGILFAAGHMAWQAARLRIHDALNCRAIFRSNATLGWIVFAGTVAINAVYRTLF